jgi:hypothetical protein
MMKMPQANGLRAGNFLQFDSCKIRTTAKSSIATFTREQLAAKVCSALDDRARSLRRSARMAVVRYAAIL